MKIVADADRMLSVSGEIRNTADILRSNMDSIEFLVGSLQGE